LNRSWLRIRTGCNAACSRPGAPGPLLALTQYIHGRLQRPASVRVLALLDPPVEIRDGPLIQRDGDFLNHLSSMTKHPTPVQEYTVVDDRSRYPVRLERGR
jgi:hypothetical protein